MRINKLTIKNLRLFGDKEFCLEFNKERPIMVLHGNNGCGKSTILDAISIMCSPFVAAFPEQSIKQFSVFDVNINNQGQQARYLKVDATFQFADDSPIHATRTRTGSGKTPPTDIKELRKAGEARFEAIKGGNKTILPVLAYYGTGRGRIEAPERKRNFQKLFNRWDCYTGSLEAGTNFKRFFEWFDFMEDEERREREKRQSFDFHLPVLQAVRSALEQCVDKYKFPRIEIRPLRFVMDEIDKQGHKLRELRLEQLSDGFKIMIAMVADIASRMAEANPDAENPLHTPGIVLIDEVDLHLHPKWQRKVLNQLHEIFPQIQFIVTTHSPIVTLGAASVAQLVLLSDNGEIETESAETYINYDLNQLLQSDLYGLPSARAPQWDTKIAERNQLLAQNKLTHEDKKRLEQLDKELSVLSIGETSDGIKTNKLIMEMAKSMGIEL